MELNHEFTQTNAASNRQFTCGNPPKNVAFTVYQVILGGVFCLPCHVPDSQKF
jgi:hypothetical protein